MSETIRQHRSNELSEIYAQLNKQDVEQFYADYQYWNLQQQAATLQGQIEILRQQIATNTELLQLVHPTAIALAAVARLQASGVNDIGLLDRMLEHDEVWLDRTMQRLDYCEQFDFILDDYTQWCQNALEGAYDWIDSIHEGDPSSPEAPGDDTLIETTAQQLLQMLTSEYEEQQEQGEQQEQLSQVSQMSQPVETGSAPATSAAPVETITPADSSTALSDHADVPSTSSMEEFSPQPDVSDETPVLTVLETIQPAPIQASPTSESEQTATEDYSEPATGETNSTFESEQPISQLYAEFDPTPEELPSVEGNDASNVEQVPLQEHSEETLATATPGPALEEFSAYQEENLPVKERQSDKQPDTQADSLQDGEQAIPAARSVRRRNFLQRLMGKIG